MSTAKEILKKIKDIFTETKDNFQSVVKGKDGTEYSATTAADGAEVAVGDTLSKDGVPVLAGEILLENDKTLVVGEGGVVTEVKEPVAAPAEEPSTVITPAAPTTVTPEQALEQFAVGTPEERLTNLETVAKALMQYSYGWKMEEDARKASEAAAIEVYKTKLAFSEQSQAKFEASIKKHEEVINAMFELLEKITDIPSTEPVTLTEKQKEKFQRAESREEKLDKIAQAVKNLKQNKN